MTRPVKPLAEQPVLVINTEVRIYASEPDLQAYFQQFKPGQYATAIKRAVRAALSGGGLELGGQFILPTAADDDDDDDFSEFVS